MWEVRVQHDGLKAYRVVRGVTRQEAELKASLQRAAWNERWENRLLALKAKQEKLQVSWDIEINRRTARNRTAELKVQLNALETILEAGLQQDLFRWSNLTNTIMFTEPQPNRPVTPIRPAKPNYPIEPKKPVLPNEPDPSAYIFRWSISEVRRVFSGQTTVFFVFGSTIRQLIGRFFPFFKSKEMNWAERPFEEARARWREKVDQFEREFEETKATWCAECAAIDVSHKKLLDEFDAARQAAAKDYAARVHAWELAKDEYREKQKDQNAQVKALREEYKAGDASAVEYFFAEVLNHSAYPDSLPRGNILHFNQSSGVLIVDYELPDQSAFPSIREMKYVAARKQFQEVPVSESWLKKTYDETLYQIALRTLHELYIADESEVLKSIVFNGWVQSIDRATGKETHGCILSIQAEREEFLQINLSQVDPRACFRKLKGVASSKLIELTPVRPILSINREDHRFVEGYAVADTLDDRTNLAAMDWLDFENLIRELFEKEFSKNGGEVKITQASRDGGVDAIAFDPDPIRGGKIVIQAKRYTNVVGVAAVRDLYGTVHNEGANKGILVTTATYGSDAYEFAKDKPLTLLSGGELLSLLAAHGHRAKIDLQEAKAIILSKQN
jgi:restriction system protein